MKFVHFIPLLAQQISQADKIGVVLGYLPNNHGRNCSILVIFGHFAVTIVSLSLQIDICDDKTTKEMRK